MDIQNPITADMTIADVLQQFPQTEETLVKYKLHCIGCEVAPLETIEEGAKTHGVEDLRALLDDLNRTATE